MQSSSNNFYDEAYFDGGKGYHTYNDDGRFETDADYLIEWFNPKSTLEIGCAKGYLVKQLRSRGIKAYGIDVSEYAIAQAPDAVQDYLYLYDVTSGIEVQFPKVDLVYSIDTFEHLPKDTLQTVRKFMLKHGNDYYIKVATLSTPDWQHDPSHITMHTIDWWQNKFPEAVLEESK